MSVLFVLGISGNLLAIYLFRTTRKNPITFLLLALSVANCTSLIVGLLNRILVAIVNIDPTLVSAVWCRLRVYIGQTTVLICQSCLCLASINCYLSTCREVYYRRLARLSIARLCVIIAILVWLVHGLFNPLLTQLTQVVGKSPTCALTSLVATNYTGFFLRPVLIGLFPISLLSIFGILTYRNMKLMQQIRRSEQRSLIKMLLLQVIICVWGTFPYSTLYAYQAITALIETKTTFELAQETLALNVINILFYTPQASPFYVYCLSSKVYRKQVKDFLKCQPHNRVQPVASFVRPRSNMT
jgi:hypothetical protein